MEIEPVTREERFLAAAGGQSVTPPKPITRKEQLLQGIIDAVKSGGATPDVIENAVNNYLDANPVKPGATTEQAAQIEQNKTDIADLQTEVDELKESSGGSVDLTGVVRSVNGKKPDEKGNVEIDVSGSGENVGLTKAQIAALDGMFKVCAFTKENVSAEYSAFCTAFGIEGGEVPDIPDTPDEPDDSVVTTYTVTNKLTDVVSSNTNTSLNANTAYSATLTAADGFTMEGATVSVTMGGVDITATAYANGVVYISAVTGNVVITATAVMQGLSEYTITNTLRGVTNSNVATTVSEGGTYAATLAADDTHVLPDVDMGGSIVITMGGTDITNSVYNYGTAAISIAPVTGNIVITVNAADKPVIIEDGLQDFFDYRNAVVNADGDIESVIGDGLILNVGSTEITADGFLLNQNYDSTGTQTDYVDYDGTNHEWTAVFCYLMGSTGTYSVPFPGDEIARSGINHYPIGNYYNAAGTEVTITSDTAVSNNTEGAKLIGIIRNGATERAFYVAKQKNAAVEQVAAFNAADYSDFAYFSPLSYRHRPVSRAQDKSMMTAIYKRALTDEEIAEVVRYMKMEVA